MALLYGASRKDILMIFDHRNFSAKTIFFNDGRVNAQNRNKRAKGNELDGNEFQSKFDSAVGAKTECSIASIQLQRTEGKVHDLRSLHTQALGSLSGC